MPLVLNREHQNFHVLRYIITDHGCPAYYPIEQNSKKIVGIDYVGFGYEHMRIL